jgi:hypothetical protein
MFRLLEIEWLKLRGYRPFWVLMVVFIALLVLTNFAMSRGFFIPGRTNQHLFTLDYSFPRVWDYVGFWVRMLGGLLPVFIIISTTNEIQYRTNRQNVIDGWSRAEFFHAKWLSCVVLALAVTLVAAALGAAFGFLSHPPVPAPGAADPLTGILTQTTDAPGDATRHFDRLFYVFLLVLNYTGLAMTLSFFLKRGVLTIVLFVCFCYIVEKIAGSIVNWQTHSRLGDYFPLEASAGLLAFPKPDIVKQAIGPVAMPTNTALALTSAGWLMFYYVIGWWKLRRSDW